MDSQTSQTGSNISSKKKVFRSDVWDHFVLVDIGDPEEPKAECNHCSQLYACRPRKNGTSTMSRHLKICKKYLASIDAKQKTLPFVKEDRENLTEQFSQSIARMYLARMLIKDELPIKMVEWEGFKELLQYFQKSFVMPSRRTIARDIESLHKKEKNQLIEYMKKSGKRVCLTTDAWTSNQNMNYMVLTGHFIDGDWKLHRKILNFRRIENHKGETIANMMEECLLEWKINKVFTVTVDNASSNDVAISHLVKSLRHWGDLVLDGSCIHVRCFAHIMNLIVNDGLKEHEGAISRVRKVVKYVKSSPERLSQFKKCIDNLKISFKNNVSLDVPTRWNSMYLILVNAEKYSNAFKKLGDCDKNFVSDMEDDGPPTDVDWADIREFCKFLKVFYDTTLKVSASLHITANIYLIEVCELKMTIKKYAEGENELLKNMAVRMVNKLDKYWGSFEKFNSLFFIAVLLDPRCKSKMLKHFLSILFGADRASDFMQQIHNLMEKLYHEYKGDEIPSSLIDENAEETTTLAISSFYDHSINCDNSSTMSEVEEYLIEKPEKYSDKVDVLVWWRCNSLKYPTVSQIARDVLTIPISTVASESAFSCGGRIIDSSRTLLLPTTIEAIICTQSWIRTTFPTDPDVIDDYETIDEELTANLRQTQNREGQENMPTIID